MKRFFSLPFLALGLCGNYQGIGGSDDCDCATCDGGIVRSGVVDFCEIADVTIDANGCITGMTLNNSGVAGEYVMESETEDAFYNQTGARNGRVSTKTQESFGQYQCLTKEKSQEGDRLEASKALVVIHEYTSGINRVQGIDIVPDGTGGFTWKRSKKAALATVNDLSDTPAGVERLEITFSSTGRCSSAYTADFTIDDLIAI